MPVLDPDHPIAHFLHLIGIMRNQHHGLITFDALFHRRQRLCPEARVAREKALPFELLVPNKKTIEAMKEARRGKLPSFSTVQELMADLDAED